MHDTSFAGSNQIEITETETRYIAFCMKTSNQQTSLASKKKSIQYITQVQTVSTRARENKNTFKKNDRQRANLRRSINTPLITIPLPAYMLTTKLGFKFRMQTQTSIYSSLVQIQANCCCRCWHAVYIKQIRRWFYVVKSTSSSSKSTSSTNKQLVNTFILPNGNQRESHGMLYTQSICCLIFCPYYLVHLTPSQRISMKGFVFYIVLNKISI